MTLSVMWFRRDFRINDNKALYYALDNAQIRNEPLSLLFHLDDHFTKSSTQNHTFFFQTVATFIKECESKGVYIHIFSGGWKKAFQALVDEFPGITSIHFNKDEVGYGKNRDEVVAEFLSTKNIEVHSYHDYSIHHASEVKKTDASTYKVFTPYFRAWQKLEKENPYAISISTLKKYNLLDKKIWEKGYDHLLSHLSTEAEAPQGTGSEGLIAATEEGAMSQLQQFLEERIEAYDEKRDYPSIHGTSRMSIHLRSGTISARTILHLVLEKQQETSATGLETFAKELAWRDFYTMIYHHHPESKTKEVEEKYQELTWHKNEELLKKWKEGKTGFPIVDAGMRQLKKEGWMHNRVRMITASFLTKDLLQDWRLGERYFEEMLHDYDEATNIGSWQWAASVGTDAVPYFRVFNPTTQSKKFDCDGNYIRKYVQELREVPGKYVHEPWKMSVDDQENSNCQIASDYPEPMVDHAVQRKRAIEFFQKVK